MSTDRAFDLVLFGATGFVGELTARYLATSMPVGGRWALAGRDRAKLEAVRGRLARSDAALAELPLLVADVADAASMRAVAQSARVAITTVGPYLTYGEPLVAACAESGTDYVDLTGEPGFVDLMYLRHHATAVRTGARIVHACGFDSVPTDLGVLFTVRRLPPDLPITVDGFVRARATFSGGTLASVLTATSHPAAVAAAAKQRRAADPGPGPAGRRISSGPGRFERSAAARAWAVPLPVLDPQIVGRSAVALPLYGPDFRYRHRAAVRHLPVVAAAAIGAGALLVAAQIPPLRRAAQRLRRQGDGPSAEVRERSWFTTRFVGRAGDTRVVTEVSGGDPGYGETAKMLGESALCLAFDELPVTAGQVTTAAAMGDALIKRLIAAGIGFDVCETAPSGPPSRRRHPSPAATTVR
jgi:saccharopine dehydrogenase (NAD+, L-glutamate forming)